MIRDAKKFTDEELKQYADEHVLYELSMLHETAALLAAYQFQGPYSEAVYNALLESFLVHARNLVDFLYKESEFGGARTTDVVVEDYLLVPNQLQALVPVTQLLRDTKIRADKQVSHLTTNRATEYIAENKGLAYLQVYADILLAFKSVANFLSSQKVSDRFFGIIDDHYVKVLPGIKIGAILKLKPSFHPHDQLETDCVHPERSEGSSLPQ